MSVKGDLEEKVESKISAMSWFFFGLIAIAILIGGSNGRMEAVQTASFDSAKSAVNIAINLIGIMALWLGLVKVLEAGGMMKTLARLVKPLFCRLFPGIPSEHPAMSAMLLNISANMLGLGNAATPFGIKAMIELNKLNPFKGVASNSMCLFLAINTSSVTLLPLGVIAVRASSNASDPSGIIVPTLIATFCSTAVAIVSATLLARFDVHYKSKAITTNSQCDDVSDESLDEMQGESFDHLLVKEGSKKRRVSRSVGFVILIAFFVVLLYRIIISNSPLNFFKTQVLSYWLMPGLMLSMLAYGLMRGVKVYEAVTEGAKQGFEVAVKIIPYLVAILVAVGMFRACGAMEWIGQLLSPLTSWFGLPGEVLPMALVRPLSGGGAFGIMTSIVEVNPDSYQSFVASVMMGSTETTFYVLAIYFGSVGVYQIRHALVAALLADVTGIVMSSITSSYWWS